jgi:Protein phosphatase 2C
VPGPELDVPAATAVSAVDRRISELPSTAPTLGAVRDLPDATLGQGISFRTPAVALDGATAGRYCVAAASLAGTAHLLAGSVRQDAYDFTATDTGSLVVVVADGLGSRTHSQVGARLLCEGVLLAANGPASSVLSGSELISAGATHASRIAGSAYGLDDEEISAVAAVAVFGSHGCEVVRIGDVSAFAVSAEGQVAELFAAGTGYVNVVHSALPGASSGSEERVVTDAGTVALVTDGLANDLRTSASIRSWLSERWRAPLGPHAMGESLRYRRQGSHDDRTAVVVWTDPVG